MDFKKLKERLAILDTACIYDVNEKLKVMDPEIRPVNQRLKMIGIARTVHCKGDFLSVLKALHDASEDEVLVIDAEGDKIAFVGELFALEAQRKKLAGIVVDGACRDIKGIRNINFPVYSRYITPIAGTSSTIFPTQEKVKCGGVSVSPGDIIIGDDDGVIVMSEEEAAEILDTAQNIQIIEKKVIEKMETGKSLTELLNFFDHYAKIDKKQESQLIFTI
ncbi:MAG: RraA family protein [Candidatus Aminicenantes bacterium]|nr:MAG: RraA family protein [Candidatus Aminicenantes bacterium]